MKIYINTANQPPTCAAATSARTDASGVLLVYSSSLGSGVSALEFKRGTTVPLDVYFPADGGGENVAKLRFGLKLKGRFDDALVLLCEAEGPGEAQEDGTVKFSVKPTFSAAQIDAALAVNDTAADDLDSAAFVSEFEWENADGEITATASISTTLRNNIIRGGVGFASVPEGAAWTALMVIRLSWAEYSALVAAGAVNPDAIYLVPDAPNEVEAHDADENAHAALRGAMMETVSEALAVARETLLESAREAFDASAAELQNSLNESVSALYDSVEATVEAKTATVSQAAAAATAAATAAQEAATRLEARADESIASAVQAEADARAAADAALRAEFEAFVAAQESGALSAYHASLHEDETLSSAVFSGFLGTFASLGCTGDTVIPLTLRFYRRSGTATGDARNYDLRLGVFRAVEGAWRLCYVSENTVRPDEQPEALQPLAAWTLEETGPMLGAIPADETVLLLCWRDGVQTAGESYITFGAAACTEIPGGTTSAPDFADASAAPATAAFSPAMDLTYRNGGDVASRLLALERRLAALEEGL